MQVLVEKLRLVFLFSILSSQFSIFNSQFSLPSVCVRHQQAGYSRQ